MNKKLLTLDDLYRFYSTKKKSMKFDVNKSGEPIVVQVEGKMTFEQDKNTEGLTAVTLQACHTEKNLNSSSISFDTMQNKMLPTFKNRPILGYIHDVNGQPEFYGHNMHIDEDTDELIYDEIAVGIIPETNNARLEYDSENDRYNVIIDGYIFNDYTKAVEILEREQKCAVSVEIAIREMSYSVKDKCLEIEDGYFSGVTILGKTENGTLVKPGMANSNIRLKDFAESNNSIFSDMTEEEHSKLIDTLEKLNETLSSISNFNINNDAIASTKDYGKEENKDVEDNKLVNEEVTKVEETKDTTETESTEEETVETEAKKKRCEEETVEENPEVVEVEETEVVETDAKKKKCEEEDITDTEAKKKRCEVEDETEEDNSESETFSKTFELSHDDIRSALYALLQPYEESDNDWYWIVEVYDNRFIYEGCMGNYWGQNYTKDGDNVAFEGERYELYLEFLTSSQKAELDRMRSNYSSIEDELNKYKEAELNAQREAVFNDEAYAEFVETESFKKIKENINTYSFDELRTACDLAFAKEVKNKGTFALNHENKEEKKKTPSFFAFAKQETDSSFLDSLLKK